MATDQNRPCVIVPYGKVDHMKDMVSPEWYAEECYPDMPRISYDLSTPI